MNKQNSGWLIAAVMFIALLSFQFFSGSTDESLDRAQAAEAAAQALIEQRDSLRGVEEALAAESRLLLQEHRDSTIVWRQRNEASEMAEQRARERASETATEVMEHTDSIGRVRFQEHLDADATKDAAQAEREAAKDSEIASLEVVLSAVTAERDLFRDVTVPNLQAIIDQKDIANDAVMDAFNKRKRQSWFERGGAVVVLATLILR